MSVSHDSVCIYGLLGSLQDAFLRDGGSFKVQITVKSQLLIHSIHHTEWYQVIGWTYIRFDRHGSTDLHICMHPYILALRWIKSTHWSCSEHVPKSETCKVVNTTAEAGNRQYDYICHLCCKASTYYYLCLYRAACRLIDASLVQHLWCMFIPDIINASSP